MPRRNRDRTVAVTGSRNPPTMAQKELLTVSLRRLFSLGYQFMSHGDCLGVDEFCHRTVCTDPDAPLVPLVYPPSSSALRAFCEISDAQVADGAVITRPEPFLTRNRALADAAAVLLAAPSGPERPGSGSWYTVNYARSIGIARWIFMPDGGVTAEPGLPVDPAIERIYGKV